MIQAMRPSGIFNDDIIPSITTLQWVKDDISKSNGMQSVLVEACQPIELKDEEEKEGYPWSDNEEEEKEGYEWTPEEMMSRSRKDYES